MKLAILGGSFNPLHIGHAMLAETLVKELNYEKVLFVPAGIPPHKQISGGITTPHRLEMVRAFCYSVPGGVFEMEPCEVQRGGVSYTVDTLRYIIEKYENQITGKPALVMGEDVAAQFYKWREPETVASLADLLIVPRYPDFIASSSLNNEDAKNVPVGEYTEDFGEKFNKDTFAYPCTILENPILPVSSTEIRIRVAEDKSFRYLVPPTVYDYIQRNGLYKQES